MNRMAAPTPIMGWSSWNHFRIQIDETMIRGQADALVASGMREAGYSVRDLWRRETLSSFTTAAQQCFPVPPHCVVALRVHGHPR